MAVKAGGGKPVSLEVTVGVAWAGSGNVGAASAIGGDTAGDVSGAVGATGAGRSTAAVSTGTGNSAGADGGTALGAVVTAAAGVRLGFMVLGGGITSGTFSATQGRVGNSTIRVVKAVVSTVFLMPNWPAADDMIAKCAIKTITNSTVSSASQCFA